MAALPYIQLFPADYLADTRHLTLEEHGAYLLLIMNYWQTGNALRANDQRLACVCSTDVEKFKRIKPILEEFFEVTEDENTGEILWKHARIEFDLEKVRNKSIKASRAGKKSAAQRAGNKGKSNERTNKRTNHTDTDTDTDTDTTGEKLSTRDPVPCKKIVELYHRTLPTLPACRKVTTARRAMIRQRHIEDMEQNLETWESYFKLISRSPFLMGASAPRNGSDKPFQASLDWICKAENYAKIFEGKYHD